mmetsp:Transcript_39775/g.122719  ORF Transcript_39775/g.122719 Transcript_39775/m.122719 type:complete len:930 (-) Transcript_39775:71-2860(-)
MKSMEDTESSSLDPSSPSAMFDPSTPENREDQLEQEEERLGAEAGILETDRLELQREVLEEKGVQIHQTQQRLLRERTKLCMQEVGVLRRAIAALDTKHSTRHADLSSMLESKTAQLAEDIDREQSERGATCITIQEKIRSMEHDVSGCCEELSCLRSLVQGLDSRCLPQLAELKASLQKESSEQAAAHSKILLRFGELDKGLGVQVQSLHGQQFAHSRLEQRLNSLEAVFSQQVDAESQLQQRLCKLEERLGEEAQQLQERTDHLRAMLELAAGRASACEKTCTLVGDLKSAHLELAARGADADEQQALLKERVDRMEGVFGDLVQRPRKELEVCQAIQIKLANDLRAQYSHVNEAIASEAEARGACHTAVQERLNTAEQLLADLVGKHDRSYKMLETHKSFLGKLTSDAKGREAHDASVTKRLTALEIKTSETAAGYAGELAATSDRLEQAHSRICEARAAREALAAAVSGLKTSVAGLVREKDATNEGMASIGGRVACLEQALSEADCRSSREAGAVAAVSARHAEISEVTERFERELSGFTERHSRELASVHGKLELLRSQIDDEAALRESSDMSIRELFVAERQSRDAQQRSAQERLTYVERRIGEEAQRCSMELETQRAALSKLTDEARVPEELAKLAQRLGCLEAAVGDSVSARVQERAGVDGRLDDLLGRIAEERAAREAQAGSLRDLVGKERDARGSELAAVSQRVDHLEVLLGEEMERCVASAKARAEEERRLWDAVDHHTHDVATQIIDVRGVAKEAPEPTAVELETTGSRSPATPTPPFAKLVSKGQSYTWTSQATTTVVEPQSVVVESHHQTQAGMVRLAQVPTTTVIEPQQMVLDARPASQTNVMRPSIASTSVFRHVAHPGQIVMQGQAGSVRMLSPLRPSLQQASKGDLFSQMDMNGDGVISRAEFTQAMRGR